MNRAKLLCAAVALAICCPLYASNLDLIGVTLLRQVDPTLNGSGINVAQAEAPMGSSTPYPFEVNPSTEAQPASRFTYISGQGTSTLFTNIVGLESGHADSVGGCFYSLPAGVATNLTHVNNYEANYFINSVIAPGASLLSTEHIVNQSFILSATSLDQSYDNFAAGKSVLFVSGAGNSGPVSSPATCYNGLGVAVVDGSSSYGPTADGRCKPDITAPGGATSFSTPYVSGAAAVLLQAANRGDGGANISAAGDPRMLKVLLLNGAVKPSDWTNTTAHPFDFRYGAGVLNVFNSWRQMKAKQFSCVESTSNNSGSPHPPGSNSGNEGGIVGWDFASLTNASSGKDRVNHYYFDVRTNAGATFTLTATLVWNRQNGKISINNLNLFLYDCLNSNLITCSTSAVDNVQHIFVPALPKGRYDLQVQKNAASQVSSNETYALAFEFFNMSLNMSVAADGSTVLQWPIAPAGFNVWSSPALGSSSWSQFTGSVAISNNQNVAIVPPSTGSAFFRLRRP